MIPQVDTFGANGYTGEETKMMQESRKIMGLPNLRVSATCVRVPVVRAHSVAISAEFERPVSVEEARAAVAAFSGAQLVDEPATPALPDTARFHPQGEVRGGAHPPRHRLGQRAFASGSAATTSGRARRSMRFRMRS